MKKGKVRKGEVEAEEVGNFRESREAREGEVEEIRVVSSEGSESRSVSRGGKFERGQ